MITICRCPHCKANAEVTLIKTPIKVIVYSETIEANDYIWCCKKCNGLYYEMSTMGLNKTAIKYAYKKRLDEQMEGSPLHVTNNTIW